MSCLHCCLQRRTPEVFSAGFVADRYPPLPLLYLISTFTQHFIFSRTNKKKKKSHLSSNTEPELLSLPPTLQGKPCSQERCFSHFPGGLTSSEKTLAEGMQGGGKQPEELICNYLVCPVSTTYLTASPALPGLTREAPHVRTRHGQTEAATPKSGHHCQTRAQMPGSQDGESPATLPHRLLLLATCVMG